MAFGGAGVVAGIGMNLPTVLRPGGVTSVRLKDGGCVGTVDQVSSRGSFRRKAKVGSVTVKTSFSARWVVRPKLREFPTTYCIRADGGAGDMPIAPLEPESPTGQFLVSMLQNYPHLFPAAADQQLVQLAADRDAASEQDKTSTSGTDLVLSKRIADLKAEERRKAVEEVIYALIVQKFVDSGVALVPKITSLPSDSDNRQVEIAPSQEKELEAVHSSEALEMVREHLTVVLGGRGTSSFLDNHTIAQISKLRVGQVYAASIMYGYFLRRVDQRFQLEKRMKALAGLTEDTREAETSRLDQEGTSQSGSENLAAEAAAAVAALNSGMRKNAFAPGPTNAPKPSRLRSYVMSFDAATLNRCATMRAKESLNVIEKHSEALFGKPEIRVAQDGTFTVASDDSIRVSFAGLRRLVLEAVAFGSFLWDVESYVDSQYALFVQ